ncbi:MAG: DUF5672 family protein [Alphaproteobacteria bacterium]
MTGDSTTTAGDLLATLAQRGTAPADISVEAVDTLYRRQRPSRHPPDFRAIADIPCRLPATDPADQIWAVIVETRRSADLTSAVHNLHRELGLPVRLFHGRDNAVDIRRELSDLIDAGVVRPIDLRVNDLTKAGYNALLLSPEFWRSIPARDRVLIFQTDTIVCAGRDYELTDFDDLDLVGAEWDIRRPVGFAINGGSGGFSLRNKQMLLDCLDRFPPDVWRGGEDGYFGFHIELLGGKVASSERCAMFATQRAFRYRSLGAHKITTLNSRNLRRFLAYCPEAHRLLPADTATNG